jgi:6-pyruvoyltetrahydropterin/6-carboxytetrahydropterin synthase
MVCDFKIVKELVGELLESYDHALCMNTDDPKFAEMKAAYGERIIPFDHQDPTTEVMAFTIHQHCEKQLSDYSARGGGRYAVRSEVRLVSVRVWETSSSWAEYSA